MKNLPPLLMFMKDLISYQYGVATTRKIPLITALLNLPLQTSAKSELDEESSEEL